VCVCVCVCVYLNVPGTNKLPSNLNSGNAYGQLNLGDTRTRVGSNSSDMGSNLPFVDLGPNRTAIALSAGTFHTCVICEDGGVLCWGDNSEGQLGVGDTINRGSLPGVCFSTSAQCLTFLLLFFTLGCPCINKGMLLPRLMLISMKSPLLWFVGRITLARS
jgi:hypothetical protein